MIRPPTPLVTGLLTLLFVGGSVAETRAADVPLDGKRLVLVQRATRERLVMLVRDAVSSPTEGGTDDPTITGATLTVVNPSTLEGLAFDMPASNWSLNRAGTRYRYRDRGAPGGPLGVKRAVLRGGRVLKVVSAAIGLTLDEAAQGSIGLSLTMGTTTYCTLFGGVVRRDEPGRFIAKEAPAPIACPGLGGTTTTLPGGTTSTTIVGTTTTTTIPPGPCCNGAQFLSFTTADAPGDCGDIVDVLGGSFGELECSGLYFGGGGNSIPLPSTIPDRTVTALGITSCMGQTATLTATSAAQTGTARTCSAVGCLYGAPQSVPNANSTPTSTCVLNTVATAGAGSLDCATGDASIDLPLTSEVFLTGDLDSVSAGIQPCPRCVDDECVKGPSDGEPCSPGSSALSAAYPTSHDCPPPASLSLGGLPIGFALTTGIVSWTATPATNDTETAVNQARVFAGFCRDEDFSGAFVNPAQKCWENGTAIGGPCAGVFETCAQRNQGAFGPVGGAVKTITAIGSRLTGILAGPTSATLAGVFAVPPTFDPLVDAAGDLPAPGAVTLPGTGELCATLDPCVPPVVPTTTTLPEASTSTTLATTTSTVALTTTSTSTTTTSTLVAGCAPPANPAGAASFVTETGSLECGGPGLDPAPEAPFSGVVLDGNDVVLADLGVACLYVGGGLANALPPPPLPDGVEAMLNVDTVNGLELTIAASNGTGIRNCTRGAGPGRHCMSGAPGTDGNGACTVAADCGQGPGGCLLDANCFFGPPIPLAPPAPALATCVVNVIATDPCGALDLGTLTASLEFALSSRFYLTQNPAEPCPRCVAGVCTAGARAGLGCSGGVGSNGTSNECPPVASTYVGELLVNPVEVSSGTSELVADAAGSFCPGQRSPGAVGTGLTARTIRQTGTLVGGGGAFSALLAGNVCAPSSGNPLVDSVEDLPGPVSLSATGSLSVCLLPDICDTLCNPCELGPLCSVVCSPCLTCVP